MTRDSTKDDRRNSALESERARLTERLAALTVAMMRADAAFEAYKRERAPLIDRGISDHDLLAQAEHQQLRVENNDYTRAIAHLTTWFALLYVVVEAWRRWGFFDSKVDPLLTSEHVAELKRYRHAIFHADELDSPGLIRFKHSESRSQWITDLSNCLRHALRDWHANLPDRIARYVERSAP